MRKDNRKFCASIYVRNGEQRVKLELAPAPLYGGPEGFYRYGFPGAGWMRKTARRAFSTETALPFWRRSLPCAGWKRPLPARYSH